MTDDERRNLEAILADLEAEEGEQIAERGYASSNLMRAGARLSQLLGAADEVA